MILRGISKSVKFMIIDSTELVNKVIENTNLDVLYSKDVSKLTTMGAILAQSIKLDNTKMSLSLKSEGALRNFVAKSTKNSNIAVKVDIDQEKHIKLLDAINTNNTEEVKKLYDLTGAQLQVMIDYGLKQPYSSIFIIEDNLLELSLNKYYEMSEQTKTILICSTKYDDNLKVEKASGLLIQLLPNGDENVLSWLAHKLERLLSITDMLKNDFSLERIAHLIFENDEEIFENEHLYKGLPYDKLPMTEDIEILEKSNVTYECDCNKKYMERALDVALTKEEKEEIIKEDGFIEIECNFCGKKYKIK
ncbi:Hsp33 family molecular chaperone HslO [Streptobacillus felis]|uniref:Hsp33 family molecular chaperone HslO n=1 Tax=Streptobacillus felis TaxID=1384509 RepID=A0A7Z0PFE2_9FUSO|nr:Hsp33 family molecular chaperone HslO [Streptobacillus felis]NYV27557.1 Hsp33 family molecular chaperone HslO [Streptobacillus felis]